MTNAIWAGLGLAALLWPSRTRRSASTAPLSISPSKPSPRLPRCSRSGFTPASCARPAPRAIIVLLLAWQALVANSVSMDGWCLRFVSPVPLFRATGYVPHSWDVRADWRTPVPECSAIMRRCYTVLEEFPVWFYNLPPVLEGFPAEESDRPPLVRLNWTHTATSMSRKKARCGLRSARMCGSACAWTTASSTHDEALSGIRVPAGSHRVTLEWRPAAMALGACGRPGTAAICGAR